MEEEGGDNLYGMVDNDPISYCDIIGAAKKKYTPLYKPTERDTRSIQEALGVHVDGDYGVITAKAVKDFQIEMGIKADGKWGKDTEAAYQRFLAEEAQREATTANTMNIDTTGNGGSAIIQTPTSCNTPCDSNQCTMEAMLEGIASSFSKQATIRLGWELAKRTGRKYAIGAAAGATTGPASVVLVPLFEGIVTLWSLYDTAKTAYTAIDVWNNYDEYEREVKASFASLLQGQLNKAECAAISSLIGTAIADILIAKGNIADFRKKLTSIKATVSGRAATANAKVVSSCVSGGGHSLAPGKPTVPSRRGTYQPPPQDIKGIPSLESVRRKTPVQGGGGLRKRWKDKDGNIYEWDSKHGTLEKYNRKGKHLGEFDPDTGKPTKPADPTRNIGDYL